MSAVDAVRPRAQADGGWTVWWPVILAGLVTFRLLVPLALLAATGGSLPLLPRYEYVPLDGDAVGYYQAISALFAAFRPAMLGSAGLVVVGVAAASVAGAILVRRRGLGWVALVLPALALSIGLTVLVRETEPPGAAVIGWSLAWAAALFPLPVLGLELTPDRAFPVGLVLGLAANAVTTIATAYLGLRASGQRPVGLVAAGLYATWPVWVGLVAGKSAWENSQWFVDVGLHLYTEPLSTALVTTSLALLLSPTLGSTAAAGSGLALGFATLVKLTNGLIGLVVVPLVAFRHGFRRALPLALGGLVWLSILIAYWPKGYVKMFDGKIAPVTSYSVDYIWPNLRSSSIFTPAMLLLLLPLAAVGVVAVGGWYARCLLAGPILVTALGVGGYFATYQHPRFYFAILPCVFVLQAAGAGLIVTSSLSVRLRSPS